MLMKIIFVLDRAICNRKLCQQVSSSELRSESDHNGLLVQRFPTGGTCIPRGVFSCFKGYLRRRKMLLQEKIAIVDESQNFTAVSFLFFWTSALFIELDETNR